MTQQKLKIQQDMLADAYRDYRKALVRYSLSKLRNPAMAEDAVQDAFVRAWNFLRRDGTIDDMKSFLYKILGNLIIDEYRRRRASSLDALVENGFEPADDAQERFVDILDGRATALSIKKLPVKYEQALSMRYMKNLSIEEISRATHQSKNAVTVRIHRGLQKLKTLFTDSPAGRYQTAG